MNTQNTILGICNYNKMSTSPSELESNTSTNSLPSSYIEEFEKLNKWKGCLTKGAPKRYVYEHNRSRAAATGFPTRLQEGISRGLTNHEIAAVFGWTTGDYRLINPIARGEQEVEFEDYPFLPYEMKKSICILSREDVMPYVHVLHSALLKLPPLESNKQWLWRGHRRKEKHEVGNVVILKGFTSVTRDRDNAIEFAAKSNEGKSDKRVLFVIIEHFSSRCIAKLSARPDEMEVLFLMDTAFQIVGVPNYIVHIELVNAVDKATGRLRNVMPDAEIDIVYLKEVKNV